MSESVVRIKRYVLESPISVREFQRRNLLQPGVLVWTRDPKDPETADPEPQLIGHVNAMNGGCQCCGGLEGEVWAFALLDLPGCVAGPEICDLGFERSVP